MFCISDTKDVAMAERLGSATRTYDNAAAGQRSLLQARTYNGEKKRDYDCFKPNSF